jgi:hypothetical protein
VWSRNESGLGWVGRGLLLVVVVVVVCATEQEELEMLPGEGMRECGASTTRILGSESR